MELERERAYGVRQLGGEGWESWIADDEDWGVLLFRLGAEKARQGGHSNEWSSVYIDTERTLKSTTLEFSLEKWQRDGLWHISKDIEPNQKIPYCPEPKRP